MIGATMIEYSRKVSNYLLGRMSCGHRLHHHCRRAMIVATTLRDILIPASYLQRCQPPGRPVLPDNNKAAVEHPSCLQTSPHKFGPFKGPSPFSFGAILEQILLCSSSTKFYVNSIFQIQKSSQLWQLRAPQQKQKSKIEDGSPLSSNIKIR